MKTSVKKALSFFMAVAVMLSCITITPVSVSASEETPTSGECGVSGNNVTWNFDSATGTLTISGTGAMKDMSDVDEGEDVQPWLDYHTTITKIVIEYGVTQIGENAFYNKNAIYNVEEVIFKRNENGESSVKLIKNSAFRECKNLNEIVIPASVVTIENNAFRNNDGLITIEFEEGSNLTTLGRYCFYASHVSEWILPSKVITIDNFAFASMTGSSYINTLYYPSGVSFAGNNVFYKTDTLKYFGEYTVNETDKTCSVKYIGPNESTRLPDATIVPTASEIIIPEKLDGYEVVQATISDNTVDIPKSFEADHKIAKLSDIEALKGWTYTAETDELPLGGSVEVTATYNLSEIQKLTKKISVSRAACVDANKDHKCDLGCDAVMGDCVDANKDHKCDYGCSKVTAHTWDKGVVTKKATATAKGEKTYTCTFCKATKKEEIAALGLPKKGSKYTSDDGKAKYKITKSDAKKGTVSFVAPANKKATTVTIPSTVKIKGVTFKVTAIEKNAFKNNKKVKNVTIGKNVTTIGENAFYKCTALTKITIPSKVTTIGKKAFYGCSKLKKLTIKSSKLTEKKIGSKAFSKTPKSMKVTVPKKKFKTYKSMLIKKGVNKKAKFVKG